MSFSIQPTLSRVTRFKTIVNLAVGLQLLVTPISVYAQENVSAAAVLPYCGFDKSILITAGVEDNFVAEPDGDPTPSPALVAHVKTFAGAGQNSLVGFDSTVIDHFMAHTIKFLEYAGSITKARLTTALKPISTEDPTDPHTDVIGLRFADGSGIASSWQRFLGTSSGNSAIGLRSNVWDTTNYPNGLPFPFELGNLPLPTGSINLLNDMNTKGFLDFYVQDDTSVDYVNVELCVKRQHDFGDAPDSTNNLGGTMFAYPGVQAHFPTALDTASAPGPKHLAPLADAWLGAKVSRESDADQGWDEDGVNNITPPSGMANMDNYDDGVRLNTLMLPPCGQTSFQYDLNVVGVAKDRYTNVWIDFNQDGDWKDGFECTDKNGQKVSGREWVVMNQKTMYGPNAAPYLVTTPIFNAMTPCSCNRSMWLRITVSEGKAATYNLTPIIPIKNADGRGPANGYSFGETEDYLLNAVLPATERSANLTEERIEFIELSPESVQFTDGYESEETVEEITEEEATRTNKVYVPLVHK